MDEKLILLILRNQNYASIILVIYHHIKLSYFKKLFNLKTTFHDDILLHIIVKIVKFTFYVIELYYFFFIQGNCKYDEYI